MANIAPYTAQQPIDDFSLIFTDFKYNAALTSGADTSLTIPGVAPRYKAVVKVTAPTWVAYNQTASSPVSATFVSTNCELIISSQDFSREVTSGNTLHFLSQTSGANVSVVLYGFGTSYS